MENTILIYTLESSGDPNNIRYVGMTRGTLKSRLKNHIKCSKGTYKDNWIKKQKKLGYKIIIKELDAVNKENWDFFEKYWIEQFKQWGFKLTNTTLGGETGLIHTKETIEKLRQIAYFKHHPENTISDYYKFLENEELEKKRKKEYTSKKSIIALDKTTGELYKEYPSIIEASINLNIDSRKIQDVLREGSRRLSYKGFIFLYSINYDNKINYLDTIKRATTYKKFDQRFPIKLNKTTSSI